MFKYHLTKLQKDFGNVADYKEVRPDEQGYASPLCFSIVGYIQLISRDKKGATVVEDIAEITPETPAVGKCLYILKGLREFIRTSIVEAMYVECGSPEDKLILPSTFPKREGLIIPDLGKGDALFATINSIYHARKIEEVTVVGGDNNECIQRKSKGPDANKTPQLKTL